MERLQLIKQRRCEVLPLLPEKGCSLSHAQTTEAVDNPCHVCREEDRLRRIKDEGWDRFAPESDANRRYSHLRIISSHIQC